MVILKLFTVLALFNSFALSVKHLQTGDALPPFSGNLRLFAMRFCPFSERAVLVLNAKNITYDIVFINLKQRPEWFSTYSPKGTVPALEYEKGKAIFDSNIITTYLDERYPDKQLQAADPLGRAQDKMIIENFNNAQTAYSKASKAQDDPAQVDAFHKGLLGLQQELALRGPGYLHGDQPGWVDYTLWPFLERFGSLTLLGKPEYAIDQSKYKLLTSYISAMKAAPAVQQYCLSPATHAQYTQTNNRGKPDYDLALNITNTC